MARLIDADVFRESIKGWKISKISKGELLWDLDHKPTVDAVPVVHGRWVRMDTKYVEQFRCSVCRSECYVPTCMGNPMYDYCPNCGAHMDLEE